MFETATGTRMYVPHRTSSLSAHGEHPHGSDDHVSVGHSQPKSPAATRRRFPDVPIALEVSQSLLKVRRPRQIPLSTLISLDDDDDDDDDVVEDPVLLMVQFVHRLIQLEFQLAPVRTFEATAIQNC